jgi:hypothetical protein
LADLGERLDRCAKRGGEKRSLENGLSAAVIRDMRRHIETPLKPVLAAMLTE